MRRVALAVAAAVLLAACTSNADKPTAAAAPTGGTLRIAVTEPGSVDPGNAYEPSGVLIDELLCEPLLSLHPVTGELEPALATNWVVSSGGRRVTLRLRKARFSNGDRVTADAVVRSLSRAASEEFAGKAAGLLEPIVGFDAINGRVEADRERDRQRLRGLTVIDRSSFSIDMDRRDADFLRVLTHPVAAPIANPADDGSNPVCAGPYKLEQPWRAGQPVIRLIRNEHYHGRHPAFSNGGRGYADTVEFHVTPNPFAAWQAGTGDVAAAAYAEAQQLPPPDRHEAPSGHIDFVGLPLGEGSPFRDPALRRALSDTLDRTTVLEGRPPARGFLPATECEPPADGAGTARPPAGLDLKLYFHDEFANRTVAEAVARQWREKAGLAVTPTPIGFDELAAKAAQPQGVDGAFLFGWRPPVSRPDAYLAPLFTSAGIGRDNFARHVDPTLDRTLEREARGAADDDDRVLGYRAAHQRLCETMPLIPLTLGMSRYAIRGARVAAARPQATLDRSYGRPVLRELYLREGAG